MPSPEVLLSAVAREETGRLVASVMRVVGDLDRAEEIVQETFAHALQKWRSGGAPDNPAAWLTTAARNRALDERRHERHVDAHRQHVLETEEEGRDVELPEHIGDERLRLIFMCCHPELPPEARVALTLRLLGGLSTEEIARAYLVPEPTMAQRLVRAKRLVRDRALPYVVPEPREMQPRLGSVLEVLYLVFNAGYSAHAGESLQRVDLCAEAIRLNVVLTGLVPLEPEPWALLALMKFHAAREATRIDPSGRMVLLEHQDRSRWNRVLIDEALAHLRRAMAIGDWGPYVLQAAIAGVHAVAPSWDATDWAEQVRYYELLLQQAPSPVIALNHAVAVAYARGPQAGLTLLEPLREELDDYHWFHAARGELLRRSGDARSAAAAFERALQRVGNAAEREFLEEKLRSTRGA